MIVLMTVAVFSACAGQYCPESDFVVELVEGGRSVRTVEYVGGNQVVRIPSRINRRPVTHIGYMAFAANQLVNVAIPNSVTHIETWGFAANQLSSMTIPNSVTHIRHGAFAETNLSA